MSDQDIVDIVRMFLWGAGAVLILALIGMFGVMWSLTVGLVSGVVASSREAESDDK